jgi:hypothetical protein
VAGSPDQHARILRKTGFLRNRMVAAKLPYERGVRPLITGRQRAVGNLNADRVVPNAQELKMNKAVTFTLLTLLAATPFAAMNVRAANVPCEEMLKDMRAAKATAKLSDADMASVKDLETKAVERCNADDDARSDKFLTDAMKIMGK